jgi:hypothetical protein
VKVIKFSNLLPLNFELIYHEIDHQFRNEPSIQEEDYIKDYLIYTLHMKRYKWWKHWKNT